jgi:predicted site-specific integrase-resolvase
MSQPEPTAQQAPVMTLAQFSERYNVAISTLHRWRANGTLRTIKVGGKRLIRVEDAEALFQ